MNNYLKQLHEKVAEHNQKVEAHYPQGMHCKNGCSKCCYVDLSVFNIEAEFIRDWFSSLSLEVKSIIKEKWNKPLAVQENFFGQMVESCPFLVNESCSIYEARPLICRTQGLPLKFTLEEQEDVDACPLNFNDQELEMGDCLDLDRLNTILGTLQIQAGEGDRVRLKDLREELKDS